MDLEVIVKPKINLFFLSDEEKKEDFLIFKGIIFIKSASGYRNLMYVNQFFEITQNDFENRLLGFSFTLNEIKRIYHSCRNAVLNIQKEERSKPFFVRLFNEKKEDLKNFLISAGTQLIIKGCKL